MFLLDQLLGLALIAVMTIFDPFQSVNRLVLLVILLTLAALAFMTLDFHFLGLSYLIVYSGALAILFLFVIMTLDIKTTNGGSGGGRFGETLLPIVLFALAFTTTELAVSSPFASYFWPEVADAQLFSQGDLALFGLVLYSALPIAMALLAVALWIVLIGIIQILISAGS